MWAVAIALAWLCGYALVTCVADAPVLAFLTNVIYMVPDTVVVVVAVAAGSRWRRLRPRVATTWTWVAVSFAVTVVGDLVYAGYYYVLGRPDVYPSWADPLWVVADLALLPVVIYAFPSGGWSGRWRAALDASVAALGLGTVLWALLLGPTWGAGWSLAAVVTVGYPLIDLVWLVVLVSVGFTGYAHNPRSVQLLTAGAAIYAATDVANAYLSNLHSYVDGKWLDIGWQTAGVMMFLAAATAAAEARSAGTVADLPGGKGSDSGVVVVDRQAVGLVPVLAGMTAMLVVVTGEAVANRVDTGSLLLSAAAVVAVCARLVWSIHDQRGVSQRLALALSEQRRLATTDVLTGLANRRHMSEQLDAAILGAVDGGPGLAILMIDLDNFKRVNDRRGHPVGDDVLQEMAVRLRSFLRADDVVGRWGGEEFLCLLPATDVAAALVVAERVRHGLSASPMIVPGDRPIWITASIGAAATGREANTARQLLQSADDALYTAKASGRNQVRLAAHQRP